MKTLIVLIAVLLLLIAYLISLLANWSRRLKQQQAEIEGLRAALRAGCFPPLQSGRNVV